jgi:hypothetical protein
MSAPKAQADSTADRTVFGISWNFRSRKIFAPDAFTSWTKVGPPKAKSWSPILYQETSLPRVFIILRAESTEGRSSATIILSFVVKDSSTG